MAHHSDELRIPTHETWALYYAAYSQVKEEKRRQDPGDELLKQAMASPNPSGFYVSYKARIVQGKGRGLIAKQDIPIGTRICDDRGG